MATQTAKKPRKVAKIDGAKVFRLLRAQRVELDRLEAKDNWQARTAEIQALKQKISELEALRARESKEFLESPKFQLALKEKERRARRRAIFRT